MCGIVGLISKKVGGFFHNDLEMFQGMLVNDTVRGEDSTGAFYVGSNGDAEAIKIASHPFDLFATKGWESFRSSAISRGRVLVGHNRKATQGAINTNNAHPFHEGKILLVHNGTLRNHQKWKTEKAVDSNAIAHQFNERNHEDVIKEIEGAFALVWYNLEEEKVFFIRNDERPLCFVSSKDVIAFASESWMPYGAFNRRGDKVEEAFALDVGLLYEYDLKKGEFSTKKLELFKETVKSYYPSKATQNTWPYNDNYRSRYPYYDNEDSDPYVEAQARAAANAAAAEIAKDKEDNKIPVVVFENKFKVGDIVQVKIHQIKNESKTVHQALIQSPKAYGKVLSFDGTEFDVDGVGWLPADTKVSDWGDWQNGFATAEVDRVVSSTCGFSLWLKNFEFDDTVECFEGNVGEHTWKHHIVGSACTKCSAEIMSQEAPFVSINRKKSHTRVICGSCVTEGLNNGDQKNALVQRRNTALQDGKSVSKESEKPTQPAILLPGTSAVQ